MTARYAPPLIARTTGEQRLRARPVRTRPRRGGHVSGGRVGQVAADVADHERACLLLIPVVEEAIDAGGAAGAGAGPEPDGGAQAELPSLPADLVVAAAGAAPVGRVGDPVETEPARD